MKNTLMKKKKSLNQKETQIERENANSGGKILIEFEDIFLKSE